MLGAERDQIGRRNFPARIALDPLVHALDGGRDQPFLEVDQLLVDLDPVPNVLGVLALWVLALQEPVLVELLLERLLDFALAHGSSLLIWAVQTEGSDGEDAVLARHRGRLAA